MGKLVLIYNQGLICAGTSRIRIRHLILLDPPPHAPMKDVCADL